MELLWDKRGRMMTEYEKELNELKEQILKDGDTLVSKRALLERFCEIDKEYNGEPWNLLQILYNINILIGQESCEDAVSRKEIQQKINRLWNSNGDKDYCMETLRDFVAELSPVMPKGVTVTDFVDKCRECGKLRKSYKEKNKNT